MTCSISFLKVPCTCVPFQQNHPSQSPLPYSGLVLGCLAPSSSNTCIATNTAHANDPITISTPPQYGTVRCAMMRRPWPLMLGGMIRCPCGCEYVYGSNGATKGGSVGETSMAESWGLGEEEEVP